MSFTRGGLILGAGTHGPEAMKYGQEIYNGNISMKTSALFVFHSFAFVGSAVAGPHSKVLNIANSLFYAASNKDEMSRFLRNASNTDKAVVAFGVFAVASKILKGTL